MTFKLKVETISEVYSREDGKYEVKMTFKFKVERTEQKVKGDFFYLVLKVPKKRHLKNEKTQEKQQQWKKIARVKVKDSGEDLFAVSSHQVVITVDRKI